MDKLLTGNIWKQIATQAGKETKRTAAIAYVSDPQHLRLKRNDVLVCDASESVIRSGGTSAKALKTYLSKGVRLYSHKNLHAKLVVFGANVLVGSCNVSSSSANRLREAALLTARPAVRSQALALISMAQRVSEEIDENFIKRASKIKVSKRRGPSGKRKKLKERLGNRTWIIKTQPLAKGRYKDEQKLEQQAEKEVISQLTREDSEVHNVRWIGRSPFRRFAKEGDSMIEVHSLRGSKRTTVYGPVAILKRQDQGKWTRFYYEYSDDLPEASWTDFEQRIRKLGLKTIKRGSTRELKANEAALLDVAWSDLASR